MIRSKPEIKRKIPPLISSAGIFPWDKLFWASNKRLSPRLLTKNIPINAVSRIIAIVFNIPILDPIVIKILISIIGIIIKVTVFY